MKGTEVKNLNELKESLEKRLSETQNLQEYIDLVLKTHNSKNNEVFTNNFIQIKNRVFCLLRKVFFFVVGTWCLVSVLERKVEINDYLAGFNKVVLAEFEYNHLSGKSLIEEIKLSSSEQALTIVDVFISKTFERAGDYMFDLVGFFLFCLGYISCYLFISYQLIKKYFYQLIKKKHEFNERLLTLIEVYWFVLAAVIGLTKLKLL